MNTDERRIELLNKANSLIDTISESMRTIENVEGAKSRFLRADSALSLEIPIEGYGGMSDVFKLDEIFDEKGIEKIKAFILTQLELLEEGALKILDTAGFHEAIAPKVEIPFAPDPSNKWEPIEEDDSDMIVVPEKFEKSKGGRPGLPEEEVEKIRELARQGKTPSEIAREAEVSYKTAAKYAAYESTPNEQLKSGRSVS